MMHHPDAPQPKRRPLRTVLIMTVSVLVVGFIFRLTEAGNLSPASVPATDSMPSLASISEALTGTSFDSSGITGNKDGNIFEVTKCIIDKMTGGTPCP